MRSQHIVHADSKPNIVSKGVQFSIKLAFSLLFCCINHFAVQILIFLVLNLINSLI